MEDLQVYKLIAGCLQQNRKDQELLYKMFRGFAMSICLRYAGNRYEAAEIMNQGFMKIFTGLPKYDFNGPFKSWVGKIMVNSSIDYYRSNLKTNNICNIDSMVGIAYGELPDHNLIYDDLLAMIQFLPSAYRMTFNLSVIEGYSHEEIAKKLGISVGTTKSNLFKARKKLKELIIAANDIQHVFRNN